MCKEALFLLIPATSYQCDGSVPDILQDAGAPTGRKGQCPCPHGVYIPVREADKQTSEKDELT